MIQVQYQELTDWNWGLFALPDEFEAYYQEETERFLSTQQTDPDEVWAAMPATISIVDEIHYNFGKAYFPGMVGKRSQYLVSGDAAGVPANYIGDRIIYIPFYVPYPIKIEEIGLIITSVSAFDVRLGIYRCEKGFPDALIYQNVIAANSLKYRPCPAIVFLSEGMYCFAILSNGTITVVRADTGFIRLANINSDDVAVRYTCLTESQAYGDLPTVGNASVSSIFPPLVVAKLG